MGAAALREISAFHVAAAHGVAGVAPRADGAVSPALEPAWVAAGQWEAALATFAVRCTGRPEARQVAVGGFNEVVMSTSVRVGPPPHHLACSAEQRSAAKPHCPHPAAWPCRAASCGGGARANRATPTPAPGQSVQRRGRACRQQLRVFAPAGPRFAVPTSVGPVANVTPRLSNLHAAA